MFGDVRPVPPKPTVVHGVKLSEASVDTAELPIPLHEKLVSAAASKKRSGSLRLFVPPVPKKMGLDLLVQCDELSGGVENSRLSLLMMDPETGLAPLPLQEKAWSCTVTKNSGAKYTPTDHGLLHDYLSELQEFRGKSPPPGKEGRKTDITLTPGMVSTFFCTSGNS